MSHHNSRGLDRQHHFSPFGDWRTLNDEGGRRMISAAAGVYIEDEDGKRLLDGMSGLWNVPLGYSCAPIKDAIKNQLDRLPYYNSFKTSNPQAARLSAMLAEIAPGDIDHFFYASSGSEAVDSAYRLVMRYWQLMGKPQKRMMISRHKGYHGSSVFGCRLGGMAFMHAQTPDVFQCVHHIDNPYSFEVGQPYNDAAFGLERARQLEQAIEQIGAENIAAFIGEPVQGAAGVYIPPDSYWPEIERICRKHDILLISDEVICGFGRTGRWFGCENWGITPDVITMAKAIDNGYLPLAAVGVSRKLADVLLDTKAGEFAHGYTNSAQPVACAAACATIETLQREDILTRIRTTLAPAFAAHLAALQDLPIVGETRSLGLIGAFELVADKTSRARLQGAADPGTTCRDAIMKHGAIMRACGHTMVSAPPFVLSLADMATLFARARAAVQDTMRAFGFS